jgi:predicted Zn-dependent protease
MLRLFSHFKKQIEFKKVFDSALTLSRAGKEEEALTKFNGLLQEQPANPYLRHQVLLLSEHLHKPVSLPELGVHRMKNP